MRAWRQVWLSSSTLTNSRPALFTAHSQSLVYSRVNPPFYLFGASIDILFLLSFSSSLDLNRFSIVNTSLEKGLDFNDFEDKRFCSLRGFEKTCHLLGQELTLKERREWRKEVTVTGPEVMQKLMDAEMAFESKVEAAKKAVRKKDGDLCQATGQKNSPAQPMTVNLRHIFCRQHYPDIAASQDNLVTLSETVHKNFHSWNGKIPCTADRLIEFLAIHHPEAENLTLRLHYTNKVYQFIRPKSLVAAK